MRISLIQLESGEHKEVNYKKAEKFIIEATKEKANIICLSENFLYRGDNNLKEAEDLSSKYINAFSNLAKQYNVILILGSKALKTLEGKITNSSLVIGKDGEIIHRYDKIYMYDVERDDLTYHESDTTLPGSKPGLFEVDGVKIGIGICVDLRYPEYFSELTKLGAEIIFLPSNFRKLTGQTAWDVLTRARAIENQVYFCACGQTGGAGAKERCGNSRVISFDGSIISSLGEEKGVITATLELAPLKKFRKDFPVLKQIKQL